ncbi:uncharacterized protein LAESUDRAFT_740624 [Laetiporus sulphureus 93-53]|uniref:Queuosine 5'-phosphate N-glycosylase/hydrolase n=1 Tax=Laetiporus sulphureus 93-53 TaxID=1314785 RepID=A0A165HS83_9APHY|nr:uncharacterized protein LAESUDRAFT_740624 [Laetiporus sulphureus 93-53]KZT12115.1 hypothetical protein LAESUDRAFT_740624 [Laetiporus sulphureus 93-53]
MTSLGNPALSSAVFALQKTDLVGLDEDAIKVAAEYIRGRLRKESYTPQTWRTQPLHLLPHEPFSIDDPSSRECLDWIFLISSLNFSFWSESEGLPDRYGVEWRKGWHSNDRTVHTGYWSLVAAIDRALEDGIPLTDPAFYSSEESCPKALLEGIFRPAPQCKETMPLFKERVAILRENARILCSHFGGSFQGFCQDFLRRYGGRGTGLQLVQMVIDSFPTFRDQTMYEGRTIYFWKRAQILVAEVWAAFYPSSPTTSHSLFPAGAAIHELTMFADYRVPQILHHLRILTYPPSLVESLKSRRMLESGCREEISIRAASIVAVEKVRQRIIEQYEKADDEEKEPWERFGHAQEAMNSVLIDFYLWDLAKKVEAGEDNIVGIKTAEMLPAHCIRSVWY